MKTVAIVLAICVVGSFAEVIIRQSPMIESHIMNCVTNTNVDLAAVQNATLGIFSEDAPNIACFLACFLKKVGVITTEGVLDESHFRAMLPNTIPSRIVDQTVKKCKHIVGANNCDTASKAFKCFLEFRYQPVA